MKARVEALCVMDKATRFPTGAISLAEVSLEGFVGDTHSGLTKKSDSRDRGVPRGTPIRNWRQWSAVSIEELTAIAEKMGIAKIEPWMLAANITFSGIANLTQLPRGTELIFEGGTILTVECENAPCTGPGKEIARDNPGKQPQDFVKAAMHMRGVVGVVYKAGIIRVGELAEVKQP